MAGGGVNQAAGGIWPAGPQLTIEGLETRLTDGDKVVSPTHRLHYAPRNIIFLHLILVLCVHQRNIHFLFIYYSSTCFSLIRPSSSVIFLLLILISVRGSVNLGACRRIR
jgi:hypothetical protein